jgi:hypothetical protein
MIDKPLNEQVKNPLFFKYKAPKKAVSDLKEAMEYTGSQKKLEESEIETIKENIEWLMDEHSSLFRPGKVRTVRKGLENLKEDQEGKTARSTLKIVRREFRTGGLDK